MVVPSEPATTDIAAGTHLWADKTKRFGGGFASKIAAVATAPTGTAATAC